MGLSPRLSEAIGQVDDPGDGADFDGVSVPGIAVFLGEDAKGFEPRDAVFDPHPIAAEGMVVFFLIFRQRFIFGSLVGHFDGGVLLLQPLIAAVGVGVSVFRQGRPPGRRISRS